MAVKRGYKQTGIGVFPEAWEVTPLGQLAEFITSGSRGWAKYYSNSGPLFVRSQNVKDGHLDFSDWQRVTPPLGSEGDRTRLRRNDLLITITGNSVGNVAWVDQDIGEAYISQHVGLVRLLNSSFAEYTCLFLSPHSPGNGQIVASQTGQSKPGLNLKNLQEFVVVMPSEPERSAIVSAWRDIDALVEELERLVAKKRDLKQAVMQQLLTGQTRLPGFTTEWRLKRLGDVAEIIMGQSPSSANYNMTGNGLPLIQGNADVKSRRAIKRIFTTQITKTGKRGDILMSVRAPVGAISLTEFDVCLGRGVCAIRFQNDFMYHFLINLENQWAKHSKGSTFDSVNSEDVRSLAVCMPIDSREQRAIAEVFNDIDCELYIRA